ncbi:hypothetical protein GH714_014629 [Hevea brasiliensis]|uniref:Protein kinase domain-containing protein n=1 Tax=Hevea brasiliensis TaxID=3981 RepID=A0A6A6NH48_HEVBR|nr:hypothetical protein GH714_014629 [Hevea brasiliensis]
MFTGKIEPRVIQRDAYTTAIKVLVAVKAEKVISKTALTWALTHIVLPGECITLLAVFSDCKTGKRFWSFPRLTSDCRSSQREWLPDRICEISESCSRMVLQFHNQVEYDQGARAGVVGLSQSHQKEYTATSSIRSAVSLGTTSQCLLPYAHCVITREQEAPLDWHSRMRIAIGTARGLRYRHEDCRVGCIMHRDIRPNNILITHDFEPLVADFALARYLAPEYIDGGKITHKVDVYAFDVVLLELMTGQRISELHFYEGLHFLSDWYTLAAQDPSHVLTKISRLLDPYLATEQVHEFPYQLQVMGQATFLCLHPDPESRPAMTKVLKILEGVDLARPLGLDLNSVGSRSGHF